MARKRRFDDGGSVREGRNENIGDDVRARALAAIRARYANKDSEDSDEVSVKPVADRPSLTAKALPKAPARRSTPDESPAETQRLREQQGLANLRRLEREDKPLEAVHPETMLPPGRMLKGLQGLASAAARRAAPELNVVRSATPPRLTGPAPRPQLEGPAPRPQLEGPAPRPRLKGPEQPKRLTDQRKYQRSTKPAKDAEEARYADEGNPNFKRGGQVRKYAAGGMVGASRRADGIAKRGKTKGRIV